MERKFQKQKTVLKDTAICKYCVKNKCILKIKYVFRRANSRNIADTRDIIFQDIVKSSPKFGCNILGL